VIIEFSKKFTKQFEKLRKNEQKRVIETLKLFEGDPSNPKLRNHELSGEYKEFRSISAGGDIRLHYYEESGKITVVFVAIGTHSQLYK
jgi:mRNA interferase YafQ